MPTLESQTAVFDGAGGEVHFDGTEPAAASLLARCVGRILDAYRHGLDDAQDPSRPAGQSALANAETDPETAW
jgi:hypothetical protein